MEVSSNRFFFRYAFTALASCSSASEDEIKDLESILISGGAPSWKRLEELVPTAIQRLNRMAEREGLDPRSPEASKKYWWEEHNRIINAGEDGYGEVSHELSEPCKVSFVEVVDFKDGKIIYYGKKGEDKRALTYFKDLEIGDFVTVHLGRVVEKISESDFKEYRE